MLKPGETVLYRHRDSVWKRLAFLRNTVAVLAIVFFVCNGLLLWFWPEKVPGLSLMDFSHYAGIAVPTLAIGLLLLLSYSPEVVVTEKRLLMRHGLVKPSTTVVPLSEIAAVRGLSPVQYNFIGVETADGQIHSLDMPDRREFVRALTKAAGLPVPPEAPPPAERAANTILTVTTWSTIAGMPVMLLAAILVTANVFDRDNVTVLGFIAFALTFTLAVPVVLGLALGWLAGNLLIFAYLRPLVTAAEVRAALQLLDSEMARCRLYYGFTWTRPLQDRLASWVYGEAMGPEEPAAGDGGVEANGA